MAIKIGELCPPVSGETQNKRFVLADFRGTKSVVLWAYPKDLTPG